MRKRIVLLNVGIISLAIHLFFTNAKLLYHMNPDSVSNGNVFDFIRVNSEQIMAMIFSLTYSIMTVIVLKVIDLPVKKRYILSLILYFALLDGLGVYIYYNAFINFIVIGSIYFGIYTFSIIAAYGLQIVYSREEAKNEIDVQNLEEIIANELKTIEKSVNARKAVLRRANLPMDKDEQLLRLLQIKDSYKKPYIPTL
jgi:hypothetical protein